MKKSYKLSADLTLRNQRGEVIFDVYRANILYGMHTTGSLRGAVKYTGMSRPNVQKVTKELQQNFVKPLFHMVPSHKDTMRMELTEFGVTVLKQYTEAIRLAMDAANGHVREIGEHIKCSDDGNSGSGSSLDTGSGKQ